MLQLDLSEKLEARLARMAQAHDQETQAWAAYLLAGLLEHEALLEDLEDVLAAERVRWALNRGEEETFSLEEVEKRLGL